MTTNTAPAPGPAPAAPAAPAAAPTTAPAAAPAATPTAAPSAPAAAPAAPAPAPTDPNAAPAPSGETKPEDGAAVEYKFEAPEGVEFDAEVLGEFTEFAKGKKLSQEDAQQLVGFAAKMAEKQHAAHVQQVQAWGEEAKADTEFGGAKFDENLGFAKAARDKFGSEKLTELLQVTGLGNHPEVIRFFWKVGKATGTDSFVPAPAASAGASAAQTLYPNMK